MGKRSDFERRPRDLYETPEAPVLHLLPYLSPGTRFAEPCAASGKLVDHLLRAGHHCYWSSDIEPQGDPRGIIKADALTLTNPLRGGDCIITNPPWSKELLHPMIEHFRNQNTTWLLFYADWMHNVGSAELLRYCSFVVPVGRVKWIEGSKNTGKDNCCWYKFGPEKTLGPRFMPRQKPPSRAKRAQSSGEGQEPSDSEDQ